MAVPKVGLALLTLAVRPPQPRACQTNALIYAPYCSYTIYAVSYAMAGRGKMAKNHIELRRKKYFNLSSQIAQLDNLQLHSLFDDNASRTGWGINHIIDLGQSKVFVKRVPVTNIEYDNLFSTKNLYDLPTYYNYGVGSAGFGVFRELVTHIKTTNWVLDGAIPNFPLMYHYRIIPFSGQRANVDMERQKGYVEYWGNSANIGNYMLDRANANYELVLFLEYIPHVLETWLLENPSKFQRALDDLGTTITFLREKGIIHFDMHFQNILTYTIPGRNSVSLSSSSNFA